jgi:hypothetical protein
MFVVVSFHLCFDFGYRQHDGQMRDLQLAADKLGASNFTVSPPRSKISRSNSLPALYQNQGGSLSSHRQLPDGVADVPRGFGGPPLNKQEKLGSIRRNKNSRLSRFATHGQPVITESFMGSSNSDTDTDYEDDANEGAETAISSQRTSARRHSDGSGPFLRSLSGRRRGHLDENGMDKAALLLLASTTNDGGDNGTGIKSDDTDYEDDTPHYALLGSIFPAGTIINVDDSKMLPDGTCVSADGIIVNTDGSRTFPAGTMINADGSITLPDGTCVSADGTIVNTDGSRTFPAGTMINADGAKTLPDGTCVSADGTIVNTDESRTFPAGTMINADGSKMLPDGTCVSADGTIVNTDGSRTFPEGTIINADGSITLPDGTCVLADGMISNADAEHARLSNKHVGGRAGVALILPGGVGRNVPVGSATIPGVGGMVGSREAEGEYDAGSYGNNGGLRGRNGRRNSQNNVSSSGSSNNCDSDTDYEDVGITPGDSPVRRNSEKDEMSPDSFAEVGMKGQRRRRNTNSTSQDDDGVIGELMLEYVNEVVAEELDKLRAAGKKKERYKSIKKPKLIDTAGAGKRYTSMKKRPLPHGRPPLGGDVDVEEEISGNLLAKYAIVTPAMKSFYRSVFDESVEKEKFGMIHHGGPDAILHATMCHALKQINTNLVSNKEISYTMKILDIMADVTKTQKDEKMHERLITFDMFVSIAALSKKISSMNKTVKNAINEMDFDALHVKMVKSKELFLLNEPGSDGSISLDSLVVTLQTGRMEQQTIDGILSNFVAEGNDTMSFFDFLSHIPLFVDVHDAITADPMTEEKRKPLSMFAIFRAQKAFKHWKSKALGKSKMAKKSTLRWKKLGQKMKEGEFVMPTKKSFSDVVESWSHKESLADVAAWKLLDEEEIDTSHAEVWFGGGLIRHLADSSRVLVERPKGGAFFDVVFGPTNAKARIAEMALLVMTCRADLPSAVFLASPDLAKNVGRGPAFPYVTISTAMLQQGFTLSFEPATRMLRLVTPEGEVKSEWRAVSAIAGSADAGAQDLQATVDSSKAATMTRELRTKIAREAFHESIDNLHDEEGQ